MFEKLKTTTARQWLLYSLLALALTDLIILLDLPLLKQSIPFLFFILVPGMMLINVLKLHEMEFIKKFLLSVGLSLFILIFTGLTINITYPILTQPLALAPVLTALNLVVIILALAEYKLNRDGFDVQNIFNFSFETGDKLLSLLIFPFIFPLMAVLGTFLMNNYLNNILLLAMLFLIPLYLLLVTFYRDRVHKLTYPVSIWLIGLSLLLMHGLTSNHIIMGLEPARYAGSLVFHAEYYVFQLTLTHFHWDINNYLNPYNACLSINILPTIFQVLTNMNPEYIFKLYYSLIGSVIPLLIYVVTRKFFERTYAFYAALLFTFQTFFILMIGSARQEIAILFFFLAVMALFTDFKGKNLQKKVLFLILIISTIVSHYTTSYVALTVIIPLLLLPFLKSLIRERKLNFKNFDLIIIYLLFVVVWFLKYAKVQFSAGADVVSATATASTGAAPATRDALVLSVLGIGLRNLPNTISALVNDVIFLVIGLGFISMLFYYRNSLERLGGPYMMGIVISVTLLASFIIFPTVSIMYGADRLFFQLLIFTAPLFILGVFQICRTIKRPNWKPYVIVILLISLFVVSTHMQYHFLGVPYSSEYDDTGILRGVNYMYDQEIVAASWLNQYKIQDLLIYGDSVQGGRLMQGNVDLKQTRWINYDRTKNITGYIFMSFSNVQEGEFYKTLDETGKWQDFSYLYQNKSLIYNNYYSNIYL